MKSDGKNPLDFLRWSFGFISGFPVCQHPGHPDFFRPGSKTTTWFSRPAVTNGAKWRRLRRWCGLFSIGDNRARNMDFLCCREAFLDRCLCEMPYSVIYDQKSTFPTSLHYSGLRDIQRNKKWRWQTKSKGIRCWRQKFFGTVLILHRWISTKTMHNTTVKYWSILLCTVAFTEY